MSNGREFKPRRRKSNLRDAKLIVIATEGMQTEKRYFEELISPNYYRNPRVHVEVLQRTTPSASSPDHVLQLLDEFKREYQLRPEDELWMVVDYDRWGDAKLSSIATQCSQKKYNLAVSTPCFELWLLLHLRPLDAYSEDELDEIRRNIKVNNRTKLEREILGILGGYNKSNFDPDLFLPHVEYAIERAANLDSHPDHRWPNDVGSRVYRLAQLLISP